MNRAFWARNSLRAQLLVGSHACELRLPSRQGSFVRRICAARCHNALPSLGVAHRGRRTIGLPLAEGRMVKNLKCNERLGFRSRNFLVRLLSETSRACTIRVRRDLRSHPDADEGSTRSPQPKRRIRFRSLPVSSPSRQQLVGHC
jgi:hypothetical protein